MKPILRIISLPILVISFIVLASAQDGTQSLGDLARQLRAQRLAQADAQEIAGLKEAPFHANILFTDSKSAVEKWVLMPAADRPGAAQFRQVTPGKKIFVPFIVTDYPFPATEKMDLTTHIRFLSPQGRVLADKPVYSENIGADPRSPSVIVLNPVMDLTFDSDDLPGAYTFRLTVVDHVHSTYARAEEKIQLIQGKTETGKMDESPATAPTAGTH